MLRRAAPQRAAAPSAPMHQEAIAPPAHSYSGGGSRAIPAAVQAEVVPAAAAEAAPAAEEEDNKL